MEGRRVVRTMKLLDRLGMAVITTILGYGSTQVSKLNDTVQNLSSNVAVLLTRYESQSEEIKDIKLRLGYLEHEGRHIR